MRHSLFSAVAALTLMAAPAFAGQTNSAPTWQNAYSNAYAKHGSASALSLNNNMIEQGNLKVGGKKWSPIDQTNSAPTHQTATSNAFAKHGDADATSANTNAILQDNTAFGAKNPPPSPRNTPPPPHTPPSH